MKEEASNSVNLLSIGGSDPSSGAGIQGDVRFLAGLGANCLTAVTAVTCQNTSYFGAVEPVSAKILKDQMDAVFSDFRIDAIKIGMVYSSQIIRLLHNELKGSEIPIIIDPVIRSTTGGMLIEESAIGDLRRYIVPLAAVITPNRFEAEIISGTKDSPEEAARRILDMGAEHVIMTGMEAKDGSISDLVIGKDIKCMVPGKKIFRQSHGGGCAHSAAVAFSLGSGKTVKEAAKFARSIVTDAIRDARMIGKGVPIAGSLVDVIKEDLAAEILAFTETADIGSLIPQCQTNFVYSKKNPTSTRDILGISGRIVRTGTGATVAGDLEYGGSKHVATALITVSKRFPKVRSAVNIKNKKEIVDRIRDEGFVTASYDRKTEPTTTKADGSTIGWGIEKAITGMPESPDVVLHCGDLGKEPMIIVFGENPRDIMAKIRRIV